MRSIDVKKSEIIKEIESQKNRLSLARKSTTKGNENGTISVP